MTRLPHWVSMSAVALGLVPSMAYAQFIGGTGDGHAQLTVLTSPVASGYWQGGHGRGDSFAATTVTGQSSDVFSGGGGRGDVMSSVLSMPAFTVIHSGGDGRGDAMVPIVLPASILVSVRVFLDGAMEDMFSMRDDLRAGGYLPLTEPYSALGLPTAGGGGEQTTPFVLSPMANNVVVDWIHVQLRSADDATAVVAVRNGLLMTNGSIRDVDGFSPLTFGGVAPGMYHVAVFHRNHLGTMTATPVQPGPGGIQVDFTQTYTMTHGTEARKYVYPHMLLWAGDASHDGVLKYTGQGNDRDPILLSIGGTIPTNTVTGYKLEDVNLDGVVQYTGQNNDRDVILQNIGGVVPTQVRQAQLP